jgi:hypothetical protein
VGKRVRILHFLTSQEVLQALYSILLAHIVLRTLILEAATQAEVTYTQLGFT